MDKQKLNIKVDDAILKGVYANFMQVMHTPEEFILDFGNAVPPVGMLTARIFISPGHLKRILKVLKENVDKYEQQFGDIKIANEPKTIGFQVNEEEK